MEKINANALSEIFIILNELKLYNKLPNEFRIYIEINKNNDHKFTFNRDILLFNQVENETTKILLSYIYINYINRDSKNNDFYLNQVKEILTKFETVE